MAYADWWINTHYSTYKPRGTSCSSFPNLPYSFMTCSFTSLLHRLSPLLGMTSFSSFLSRWEAVVFPPRVTSHVMSPMRDLPDKMGCLFSRVPQYSNRPPLRVLQALARLCLQFIYLCIFPYCQSTVTGLQQMLLSVSCMCMYEWIPKPRLADIWFYHTSCRAKTKWISRTALDSQVIILYSFIGSSHFFVVITGETTSEQLSPTEWIQEDSIWSLETTRRKLMIWENSTQKEFSCHNI